MDAVDAAIDEGRGHWKYPAMGSAKPAFDVDGTKFGLPDENPFPAASCHSNNILLDGAEGPEVSRGQLPPVGDTHVDSGIETSTVTGEWNFSEEVDVPFNLKLGASFKTKPGEQLVAGQIIPNDGRYGWQIETVYPAKSWMAVGVSMSDREPYGYPGWKSTYKSARFKLSYWEISTPNLSQLQASEAFKIVAN